MRIFVFNAIYSVQTNMNCIFHTFLGNEVMGREPHITGALQILIHKYDMDITQYNKYHKYQTYISNVLK